MTREHKRAEEALRESEERYRRLVEMSPYAIAVHSEGRMMFVNRAATELLGATDPEEIVGRPLWDFVHPDYLKAVRKRIQRASPEGSRVDLIEEKLVRLDGQTIDAEMAAIPITYRGKPARQVVFRDIAERKRAEEALRESEEKYRDLVENINDVIYQLDAEGRVTYISPVVEEIGGYSPSEIAGRPFTDFVHPEDVAALAERFREALAGEPKPIEFRIPLKSGETRWYRSFGREIREGERVVGFRGVQTDITERKRAEEALRESEARLRAFANAVPDIAFIIDEDGLYVEVLAAPETKDLLYAEGETLKGRRLHDVLPEKSADQFLSVVRKTIETQEPQILEYILDVQAGRRWFEGRTAPLSLPGGNQAVVWVSHDITERKHAEEALRDSEARYRTVVETARDVIFTLSSDGTLLSLNPAFETVTGWSRAEWIGKPFAPIIHPDDRAVGIENFQRILRGEVPPIFEVRILTKSGEYLTGEFAARPLIPDEEVVGAFGIVRDITERKRAAEAAERVRRRIETLVETSPVGVVVVDASGRVVLVNREAERITNFSYKRGDPLETLRQGAVRRRPDGTEYPPGELPIERALHKGEAVLAEEIRFHFADGRTVPTLVNAAPILGSGGRVAGAIVIIQDITPLEELENLRGEFLGIVSHELKTPVTAIKGSAAMALTGRDLPDAPQARELFEIIDEQADRLAELIDNLLDMTRIEAGSLTVNPEATDVRTVLEDVRATSARSHALHEIQIQVPDDLAIVSADRRRLAQVLLNLLSNAAKFSPEGAPITITVEHDASQVTVHVRDRGRGIPADKLPHLFKKFSRVHESEDRGLRGSGLGLAICKGIVEAHGGRIWADSEGEGKGSTFSFTLPVVSEERAAPVAETTRRAVHLGKVGRPGERTRILAVDDEPRVLRLLQRALQQAGYQLTATSDPSQVPRLVELEEPDLVLLDLFLPGTTGFDLLDQIREFSGVPVIFLTVSDEQEHAVRALEAGADDYITKPFSPSELVARIAAALRRRVVPDVTEVRPPFVLGDLTVEFVERRVTVGGRPVFLSATEYKLLYELATHAGQVLTHDQILHRVWGPRYSGETDVIRAFIRNLRRKLDDDARHPRYIFTEPQVGYRMPKP